MAATASRTAGLCGLLLLALLPSCRTAAPKTPPAGPPPPLPDLLRPYEGALRVLKGRGDQKAVTLKGRESSVGSCDVAVRVSRVAFGQGEARLALESVGLPRVGERRPACKRLEPRIELTIAGLPPAAPTPEAAARIDAALLTPEAYLQATGTAFDRPAGTAPSEVASTLPDGSDSERRLARAVVAWPRPVLLVDAIHQGPEGRTRHERLVGLEAVVGTDGRLHQPQIKGALDPAEESAVLAAVSFWRFEPARRAEGPIGARVALEAVLKVY